MANLSIRNLQKGFDGHQIIKGIDLDVKDREFAVFHVQIDTFDDLVTVEAFLQISDAEVSHGGLRS
ncbi:hypothetical protein QCD79_34590, partial [Pseudomonas quasicaspiana]|nr:hypothetical protein [Pseudomonas quasicaspiana]